MAPSPQGCVDQQFQPLPSVPRPAEGEEVVISGLSGIFPASKSVQEFMENLYNGVDMVTSKNTRWEFDHPEVPQHLGLVEGMNKFDAQFFRVHYKQAVTLEPTCRKMLEHAYSAIYDAGINPVELRGKKVGVFIGASISESEKVVQYDTIQVDGFGITGTNKSMYANRISYWLDAKGPSYALDAACSSSMLALEHAYRGIISGHCESAIVGGCSLCLQPFIQLNIRRVGFLTTDGKTKCFDKHADGYVRADAISVLFLQKAKHARRVYCEVYHAKTEFNDYIENYMPVRNPEIVKNFLNNFYKEIDVSPQDVEYIEAFAPGIAEADRAELQAIGEVYCKGKHSPQLVGSLKSNMGNSEPASGACSATKACLAFERGEIPANLFYDEPQDDVEVIRDGQVKVVTSRTPFNRGFIALNSFSYTGVNVHVLLKGRYKEKNLEKYSTSIPYLVTVSGRQESCVTNLLKTLSENPIDPEAVGLLHSIHKKDISGHTCRGYTILDTKDKKETISLSQGIEYTSGINRPVWFVYSGMGSQWAGMGKDLMRLPIFASAIERCRKVLEPKGVDLIHILTDPDKAIYDNILNSFVGIAAVQIGLTDVLRELGIVPDNIIGHSVGELGCAYADGCFTAEEMILSAYSRGLVSVQTPFIRGSMAAVGLSYKAVLPLLPPEIEVACHNSNESSTISGPADVMKRFVADLSSRGIFAKEVPCSNIAYHSRYIAGAGPGLLKLLNEVIKDPKPRSQKWLSTSVPQEKWNDSIAKYSSAEYHTNNLLNSVLFEETSKHIPSNAILIEVAPHGLLQAILKRSLPDTCVHIPLTRRGHADPIKFILDAVGKLYQNGLNPNVDSLYPKIEFPVSTGTPFLSQLVEWEHSENWTVATYSKKIKVKAGSREFIISVHDSDHQYLKDHVRAGLNVYPEAGILVRVWETLGLLQGVPYEDLSVTFHNVRFHNEAVLKREVPMVMNVEIHKGTQYFEVTCDDVRIASGSIFAQKKFFHRIYKDNEECEDKVVLKADDIYKMWKLKDHSYGKSFQSIQSSNTTFNKALIKWDNEWTTFIDALFQLKAMKRNHNGVSVPNFIQKMSIDVKKQYLNDDVTTVGDIGCYDAVVYDVYSTTRCGGVDVIGINFTDKPAIESKTDALVKQEFVPNFPTATLDVGLSFSKSYNPMVNAAISINLQIVAENSLDDTVKLVEITSQDASYLNLIKNVANTLPLQTKFVFENYTTEQFDNNFNEQINLSEHNVIVIGDLIGNQKKMLSLYKKLQDNQFVLARELENTVTSKCNLFEVVSAFNIGRENLILLKKSIRRGDNPVFMPILQEFNYFWLSKALKELQRGKRLIIVSETQPIFGLLGIVKALRKEYNDKISLVVIDDQKAPSFHQNVELYKDQLNKNLSINILKKGLWGGYYYLPAISTALLENVTLTCTVPGDLDTLSWIEDIPEINENTVQVHYAGVTLGDVGKANARFQDKDVFNHNKYGMDFSGLDIKGQRVMGFVSGGSITSNVVSDPDLTWPVPSHWSLEDAATVPFAYALAFYCLKIRSKLNPESSILVHGGAGALGQAAISIALSYGCTVFSTVSNIRKKKLLIKLFPQLSENNIGCSRDNSFEDLIMTETKGLGCDLIICCLDGLLQKASTRCLAYRGEILLLNHRDMLDNNHIGMGALVAEHNCKAVCIDSIFNPQLPQQKKYLHQLISDGISSGTVRPLTRIVYDKTGVARAFRLVGASRHCGRVLVGLKESKLALPGIPKLTLSSQSCHVVVGENETLAIELTDRLVKRGARNILLHINPDIVSGYLYTKMLSWKKIGVVLKLSSENLHTAKGCVNLLQAALEMGSVEGVYATIPSRGQSFVRVDRENVASQFNDNADIVLNLDISSRQLCSNLKYFVVIRPDINFISGCMIDDICQKRFDDNLPALALQYQAQEKPDLDVDIVVFADVNPHKISSILNTMEAGLRLRRSAVVSHNVTGQTLNFKQKIARILGVKELEKIPDHLHLEQVVGVDNINIDEISNFLRIEFGVIYARETIEKLSLAELLDIPSKYSNIKQVHKLSGLNAFISYVDNDEYLATEPIVPMHTMLSNSCDLVDEIDKSATYLMLIPGYEGHHRIFQQLCERLKIQAVTLQLQPDYDEEDVLQTAQRIHQVIRKRFVLNSKFYLLGYSFGVLIALEVAALLEKEGLNGTVFCLDSSPDVLKVQLEAYLGYLDRVKLHDSLILHMYGLMNGNDKAGLEVELKNLPMWEDKVEACVVKLRKVVTYSNQYKRSLLKNAYKRIIQAITYHPNLKPLRSQLVLLRSGQGAAGLSKDYGLSKYSQEPIKIFDLEFDNASAPQDLRCSNIINCALDSDVINEFKQNFTCDIYCADAENLF